MNTCDTCKWWDQRAESFSVKPIQGICTNPKVTGENSPKRTDENILQHGGWAELWTGPKFGCIHYEPK